MPRSLTDAQVQAATDFLIMARQKSEPFESIPEDCRPDTIDDATRVSEPLAEVLSRRPVGWKAGYSSPEQLRTLPTGAPPSSPLYAGMLQDSPAQLSTAVYRTCMIEAEVAFRLGWDLPPRDTPYAVEEVRDAVASAHAVIEAPNVRFAAGRDIGLPSIIADGYAAETLVIGPAIEDWRDRDLTAIEIELLFDGGSSPGAWKATSDATRWESCMPWPTTPPGGPTGSWRIKSLPLGKRRPRHRSSPARLPLRASSGSAM